MGGTQDTGGVRAEATETRRMQVCGGWVVRWEGKQKAKSTEENFVWKGHSVILYAH